MNIPLLAGSLFAIFGIYLLGRALSDYQKAVASLECPGVEGLLTGLRLWGKRNIDGEMQDAEKLIVGYEYKFKGGQVSGEYHHHTHWCIQKRLNSPEAILPIATWWFIVIRRLLMSLCWCLAREKTSLTVIVFLVGWVWLLVWWLRCWVF
jgi:hypothetical protein